MTEAPLSPNEIVALLLDPGLIDRGTADRLETRIAAYGETRASEGRKDGIETAARKAAAVAGSLRGATQRAAAEKVWRAIEMLLPHSREAEQAYARGFKDGAEHRSKRERQNHRPDSKMS